MQFFSRLRFQLEYARLREPISAISPGAFAVSFASPHRTRLARR